MVLLLRYPLYRVKLIAISITLDNLSIRQLFSCLLKMCSSSFIFSCCCMISFVKCSQDYEKKQIKKIVSSLSGTVLQSSYSESRSIQPTLTSGNNSIQIFMSPVSPVFHTVETVRIVLKFKRIKLFQSRD